MADTTTAQEAAAAASAALASKATNIGAATAIVSGFLAENWVGVCGLLIALAGFLVKWYYLHKEYRWKQRTANVDNNINKCPPGAKDPD